MGVAAGGTGWVCGADGGSGGGMRGGRGERRAEGGAEREVEGDETMAARLGFGLGLLGLQRLCSARSRRGPDGGLVEPSP